MLEISTNSFAGVLGLPNSNASGKLFQWIDGISYEDCVRGVGGLSRVFQDFFPPDFRPPKDTILFVVATIQDEFGRFHNDFDELLIVFLGLQKHGDGGDVWCWTEGHRLLRSMRSHYLQSPRIHRALLVVEKSQGRGIDHYLIGRINYLVDKSIATKDLGAIDKYLRCIKKCLKFASANKLIEELFEKLLSAKIYPGFDAGDQKRELQLIHQLSNAILKDDFSQIEATLNLLASMAGERKQKAEVDTRNWATAHGSSFDPSWWREQE